MKYKNVLAKAVICMPLESKKPSIGINLKPSKKERLKMPKDACWAACRVLTEQESLASCVMFMDYFLQQKENTSVSISHKNICYTFKKEQIDKEATE